MSTDARDTMPEYNGRPGTPNLAAALSKFQGAVGTVSKNKTAKIRMKAGGEFSYSYADLASIAEQAYPKLAENGLAYTSSPTMNEHGFVLEYALMHESGEARTGKWPLPDPRHVDIKEIGIAITYARRYCFGAVTGIVTEEDTDVQGAPAPRQLPPQAERGRQCARKAAEPVREETRPGQDAPSYGPNDPRTAQQSNKIFAMLGELGLEYKSDKGKAEVLDLFGGWLDKDLESTKDLTIREANKIIDDLQIMIDTELGVDPATGEVR
jgi:hypothetical protein